MHSQGQRDFGCDPGCYFKVVAFSYLIMNEIAFEDRG
jgi:hypothetical protein